MLSFLPLRFLLTAACFFGLAVTASCGGGSNAATVPAGSPPRPSITIIPASATLPLGTNQQFFVSVTAAQNNGVNWTASAGTIDANGNYVAPTSLPTGGTAKVTATLVGMPAISASATITISTQPVSVTISPLTAAVKAGFSTLYTATVSGTTNQLVNWTIDDLSGDFSYPGTINAGQYTAPAPMLTTHSYNVTASSLADPSKSASATVIAIPLENQVTQTFPIKLGTSGVNGTIQDCCSGTLGSLLVDTKGKQYLLSNNHVMGRVGHAAVGDPIVQPGYIETLCDFTLPKQVASFTAAPPITSNVDAAVAEVTAGAVDPTGTIIGLGGVAADGSYIPAPPSRTLGSPIVGTRVAKSGRTTGLSCGSVEGLNGSIQMSLPAECGNPSSTTVLFTGQLILSSMVRPGDSGSLVVDMSTGRPVGLVAGLSDDMRFASANPAGAVLKALAAVAGTTLSFVGGPDHAVSCTPAAGMQPSGAAHVAEPAPLAHQEVARALEVQAQREGELFRLGGVVGVAVGRSQSPDRAGLVVFVESEASAKSVSPELDGVPVRVVVSGRFGPGTLGHRVCAAR